MRFADINLAASLVSVATNAAGVSVISFRPQASNKRFIGPGWGPAMSVDAGGLKITNVVDKGDGSYDLVLDGKISGPFKISVDGEEVKESGSGGGGGNGEDCGPNANFWQKIKCWLMSLGLPAWSIWILLLLILLLLWLILKRFRK